MDKNRKNLPSFPKFLGLLLSRRRTAVAVVVLGLWLSLTLAMLVSEPDFDPEQDSPGFWSTAYWREGWWRYGNAAGPDLKGLSFASPELGWAVGGDGMILATLDGGHSWYAEVSGTEGGLNAVQFVDLQHGWAVGQNGTILATSDGGRIWNPQASGTREELNAVHFLDARQGWAVGDKGTILATLDGGAHWETQASGTEQRLTAVDFLDPMRGWAVGSGSATILATEDGGRTWQSKESGTRSSLDTIRFLDLQHGWIVGGSGTLLTTSDGGRTWQSRKRPTEAALEAVQFLDTQQGWAVGDQGTILATGDGGSTWEAQTSGTTRVLHAVQFIDPQRGRAVGSAGTTLATEDGGKTWERRLVTENRLPLWYWGGSILALPLILFGLSGRADDPPPDPVLAMLSSDRPQQGNEPDALGSKNLAWAISRFLRHRRTEPPLTLALSAPWGGGKSSLLNWLREDLRRFGFRPVWFNAWHYESQTQMFPALMEAVRQQAVPPWLSPGGFKFRLSLLRQRMAANPILAAILSVALLFPLGYLASHGAVVQGTVREQWLAALRVTLPQPATRPPADRAAADTARSQPASGENADTGTVTAPESSGKPDGAWQILLALFPFLAPVYGLAKALQGFKPPSELFTRWFRGANQDPARRDLAIRAQFARDFRAVTAALDRTLVVFIDDLDRCQPKSVCEIMEAVNFLASEGACHIVFGLWREGVERAIGLGFREAAAEFARIEELQGAQSLDEAEIRRRYGQLYLEKLINIWVAVPPFEIRAAQNMLAANQAGQAAAATAPLPATEAGEPLGRRWWRRARGWLRAERWRWLHWRYGFEALGRRFTRLLDCFRRGRPFGRDFWTRRVPDRIYRFWRGLVSFVLVCALGGLLFAVLSTLFPAVGEIVVGLGMLVSAAVGLPLLAAAYLLPEQLGAVVGVAMFVADYLLLLLLPSYVLGWLARRVWQGTHGLRLRRLPAQAPPLGRPLLWLLAMGAAYAGLWSFQSGMDWNGSGPNSPRVEAASAIPSVAGGTGQPPAASGAPAPVAVASGPASVIFLSLLPTGTLIAAGLGALMAFLLLVEFLRYRDEAPGDSLAFQEALQFWSPVLVRRFDSPRRLKRFLNHLRFNATRLRTLDRPDPTVWDSLWNRYLRGTGAETSREDQIQGEESKLLFLSVLEACCGDNRALKYALLSRGDGTAAFPPGWQERIAIDPQLAAERGPAWTQQLREALIERLGCFEGNRMPQPDHEDFRKFERLMPARITPESVRAAGATETVPWDPATLADRRRGERRSGAVGRFEFDRRSGRDRRARIA